MLVDGTAQLNFCLRYKNGEEKDDTILNDDRISHDKHATTTT